MSATPGNELIYGHRAEIMRIASRFGVHNIRLFGSFARGDSRPGSDIDFLVDLDPGRTLLDLIGVKQELEDLLGRSVDVVTERSLSPYIRDSVLGNLIHL